MKPTLAEALYELTCKLGGHLSYLAFGVRWAAIVHCNTEHGKGHGRTPLRAVRRAMQDMESKLRGAD